MVDPDNPRHIRKVTFDDLTEGFPDSIALCTYGSRRYFAISFEKLGTSTRAFMKIYKPLDSEVDDLTVLYSRVPCEYERLLLLLVCVCGVFFLFVCLYVFLFLVVVF